MSITKKQQKKNYYGLRSCEAAYQAYQLLKPEKKNKKNLNLHLYIVLR